MEDIFLSEHVYFCGRGNAIVFLNLENDEYCMIRGDQAQMFRELMFETDNADAVENPKKIASCRFKNAENSLKSLFSGGLLTKDSRHGKTVAPTEFNMPCRSLLDPDDVTSADIRISHVARFLTASLTASLQLRFWSIQRTVLAVQNRKIHADRQHPLDVERARKLVHIFSRLRPLYPVDALCLFNSLSLIEFLARYKIYPSWVFAVQFEPWRAHCWVQHGEISFNQRIEEAVDYVPIMAV